MEENLLTDLDPPRIEQGKPLLIAGLGQRYNSESSAGMPAQWQRFASYLGHIQGQVGHTTYGVLCNSDDAGNTEYITGVEVSDFARMPPEFSRITIPAQKYAVFKHRGHVSEIRRTWFKIFKKGLPESGYKPAQAPEFERYENLDLRAGTGSIEIWVPIQS